MKLTEDEKKARWEAAYAGDIHVPKTMHRATMALFWEMRHKCHWKKRGIIPQFNFSMKDHDDTLSFPQLYFQCSSDYEAAMVILGSWKHWEKLNEATWFAEKLTLWKEEKRQRDIAHGHARIRELADNGNLAACKILAQGGIDAAPKQKSKKKPAATPAPEPTPDDDAWLEHGLSIMEQENDA